MELQRFAASRNKQIYAAKKFYLNDSGLLFNLAGKLNIGSSSEQILFHTLRQKYGKVFFYYENQLEIDFVVDIRDKSVLIESKYELGLNKEKIEDQLVGIARQLRVKQVKVITKEKEEEFMKNGIGLNYIPLWKFLLSE